MPLLLVAPQTARAQCVSPDAGAGVIIFNNDHKVMQYCNGDDWVGIWGGGGGSGGQRISGEVATFDLTACPEGWSEYLPARGRFVRGIDNGAGNDPSGTRSPGNIQADALGSHNHTGTAASAGAHTHSGTAASAGAHTHTATVSTSGAANHAHSRSGNHFSNGMHIYSNNSYTSKTNTVDSAGAHTHSLTINSAGAHTHSLTINATGAAETRPKNVALLYCRKD